MPLCWGRGAGMARPVRVAVNVSWALAGGREADATPPRVCQYVEVHGSAAAALPQNCMCVYVGGGLLAASMMAYRALLHLCIAALASWAGLLGACASCQFVGML